MSALLTLMLLTPAQAPDAKPIVEKAIQAHGGARSLAKVKAIRQKVKGSVEIMDQSIEFTGNVVFQFPAQGRQEFSLDVMGNRFETSQVFSNGKGWIKAFGQLKELEKEELASVQAEVHEARVRSLLPLLRDPDIKITRGGDDKIDGKPVVGIKVSAKDQKDIDLYFDPASGLLVKIARLGRHPTTGKEVKRETYFSDFKDKDGVKLPYKFKVLQDGARFIDGEVVEQEILDQVDEKEFDKPGKDA